MILRMEKDDSATKNHSDFSIEHILNRAGPDNQKELKRETNAEEDMSNPFSWLQCTRFCPPRIPRMTKKDAPQKRQLGRYPRIPFTNQQLVILETKFQESPYLSSEEATNLSKKLQLADVKVKIWFQNRRARKRREEMGLVRKDNRKISPTRVENSAGSTAVDMDGASTSQGFVGVHPQVAIPFLYVSPPNVVDLRDFSHR